VNYAVESRDGNFRDAGMASLSILESVPAVSAKLKEPVTADRKFEDVVKSAQEAAVLVLVYFVVKSVFIRVHPWLIHSVPAAVQAEA